MPPDFVVDEVAAGTMLEESTLDEQYGIDVADLGTNNDFVGVGTHINIASGIGASLDGQQGGVRVSFAVVDVWDESKHWMWCRCKPHWKWRPCEPRSC